MKHTRHGQLIVELAERRRRLETATLGDRTRPIETVAGAVSGGPALLVANTSGAHLSAGIEVQAGAGAGTDDVLGRIFGLAATADQEDGVGVIGRGDYRVVGQSPDNVGVMGVGATGLFGFSNDPRGIGVEGHSASPSGIGVLASAPEPAITALAIDTGHIRVPGAGENTPTPVFVHVAGELNTAASQTVIDHPMTNGDPNAILIVTRRDALPARQDDRGAAPQPARPEPWSVVYSTRTERWLIAQPEGTQIAPGTAFNVLVFKA